MDLQQRPLALIGLYRQKPRQLGLSGKHLQGPIER